MLAGFERAWSGKDRDGRIVGNLNVADRYA